MLQLTTYSDLVAAVPSMLGYTPADQLVTVYLKAGKIEVVIATTVDHSAEEVATGLIGYAQRTGSDAVCLVVIDARAAGAVIELADIAADRLAAAGVRVVAVLHAFSITEGGRWTELRTGETGPIADPTAHPLAVHNTLNGTPTARSRGDIESWYSLAEELPGPSAAELAAIPVSDFGHRVLTELVAVITGNGYTCDDLAGRTAAFVLMSEQARDSVLGVGHTAPAVAARILTDIANRVRGLMRAQLLTIVAALWYASQHGVACRIALDKAMDAALDSGEAEPSLLGTVDFAYRISLPPTDFRRMIAAMADLARAAFDVDIPDPTD